MNLATLDAVSIAVGATMYVQSHRLGDLYVEYPTGRSPRLRVERYYWDMDSPVAVDYRRDIRYGQKEIDVKRAYFAERGARYIVVTDAHDGEGAELELAALLPEAETLQAIKDAARPLIAPRAKPGNTRTKRR